MSALISLSFGDG